MSVGAWEGDQIVPGNAKFRNFRNLIRKGNRMREKLKILEKLKIVEYSPHTLHPESEECLLISNMVVALLALEYGFQGKTLEFILRSLIL